MTWGYKVTSLSYYALMTLGYKITSLSYYASLWKYPNCHENLYQRLVPTGWNFHRSKVCEMKALSILQAAWWIFLSTFLITEVLYCIQWQRLIKRKCHYNLWNSYNLLHYSKYLLIIYGAVKAKELYSVSCKL